MQLVSSTDSTFTEQELERLAAYRAAVAAGFYTDWDGSAEATDTAELAWLQAAEGSAGDGAYPFTADERQRLEHVREGVASGLYDDDRPPVDAGATPEQQTR